MDLARIAVVHQRAFFVVAASVAEIVVAHPANPAFGVQVNEQIFGHRNSHAFGLSEAEETTGAAVSVRSKSPPAVTSSCQPARTRVVKNGPSTMAGPAARAPGSCSIRTYTGTSST